MPLIYAEGSCYSIGKQAKNGSIFNVDIGIVQCSCVCTFKMIKGKQELSIWPCHSGSKVSFPLNIHTPAPFNSMHSDAPYLPSI